MPSFARDVRFKDPRAPLSPRETPNLTRRGNRWSELPGSDLSACEAAGVMAACLHTRPRPAAGANTREPVASIPGAPPLAWVDGAPPQRDCFDFHPLPRRLRASQDFGSAQGATWLAAGLGGGSYSTVRFLAAINHAVCCVRLAHLISLCLCIVSCAGGAPPPDPSPLHLSAARSRGGKRPEPRAASAATTRDEARGSPRPADAERRGPPSPGREGRAGAPAALATRRSAPPVSAPRGHRPAVLGRAGCEGVLREVQLARPLFADGFSGQLP